LRKGVTFVFEDDVQLFIFIPP